MALRMLGRLIFFDVSVRTGTLMYVLMEYQGMSFAFEGGYVNISVVGFLGCARDLHREEWHGVSKYFVRANAFSQIACIA